MFNKRPEENCYKSFEEARKNNERSYPPSDNWIMGESIMCYPTECKVNYELESDYGKLFLDDECECEVV